MQTPVVNWLSALALALLLASGHLLDTPADHSTERAQADALSDAIKTEQARVQLARRVADRCGANAAWSDLGGGLVQCADKHGRKTMIAQVAP